MEGIENFESGLGDEMPYIPSWRAGGNNTITTAGGYLNRRKREKRRLTAGGVKPTAAGVLTAGGVKIGGG